MPDVVSSARLTWSMEDISDILKIDNLISIMHSMPMYKEYKKNFPLFKRLLLGYFDFWKIASLAQIRVGE
jgi:hypothetical protein